MLLVDVGKCIFKSKNLKIIRDKLNKEELNFFTGVVDTPSCELHLPAAFCIYVQFSALIVLDCGEGWMSRSPFTDTNMDPLQEWICKQILTDNETSFMTGPEKPNTPVPKCFFWLSKCIVFCRYKLRRLKQNMFCQPQV